MVLDKRSRELRKKIVTGLTGGGRGHLGAACSLVEILRVLYDDILHYDSTNPRLPDRDRFILSKGHGCLALYAVLADKGFIKEEELASFCLSTSRLGGHPEHSIPGVEVSTGSLGHGLSMGIGFALNARIEKKKYRVFVVIGDGESQEGSIWEAALCAGKHQLENVTIIIDYNKHQSYASTKQVQDLEPLAEKWKSFGFGVEEVDGHDVQALQSVLKKIPFEQNKPSVLIAHTVKGKGIRFAENNMQWHHKRGLKQEDFETLMKEIEDYP